MKERREEKAKKRKNISKKSNPQLLMFSRMPECRQDIFEFQFVARPVFLCALDRPSMRLICCQGLALFF